MGQKSKKTQIIKASVFGVIVLGFLAFMGTNDGAMMSLNGKPLVANETQSADNGAFFERIEPAAGQSANSAPCGSYESWLGEQVNEEQVKATGKIYRILPPGSMVTMDHQPMRINVHIDDNGIVLDVRCG